MIHLVKMCVRRKYFVIFLLAAIILTATLYKVSSQTSASRCDESQQKSQSSCKCDEKSIKPKVRMKRAETVGLNIGVV